MHVAIIGGDRRMLYAAEEFLQDGAEVFLCGFEQAGKPSVSVKDAADRADIIVLPVRPIIDGMLNAPFSKDPVALSELTAACGTKPIFSGFADSIREHFCGRVYDYAAREEFAVKNAVLTAEGAVGILVDRYQGSVFGARTLVTGYGRIGRVLSRYLKALGAEVTVAARRSDARAWAQAEGLHSCDYSFKEINEYDIIINTVPAPVLTEQYIDRIKNGAILIDLASSPGGVDADRAGERGLTFIHALALPGRTAPAAAGRIIKETICTIIKEENGGKDYCGLCDDRLLLHL